MVKKTLQKHGSLWSNREYLRSVLLGVCMLALGIGLTFLAGEHLEKLPDAMWARDLLLDRFPVMRFENILVWGVPTLIGIMVAILLFFPERIPFSLKAMGLLYMIRSLFIILTPLGSRPDKIIDTSQGLFHTLAYSTNEFFFSGHVSFPFMFALLFWDKKSIRYAMLIMTLIFGIAVLFAHTHYSIDVFAVPFIVPSIYQLNLHLFASDRKFFAFKKRTKKNPFFLHDDQPHHSCA